MPDAFLETPEHGFLVAGVDVDDAVGGKTDLRQRGRKKVLPGDAPEDFALCPRRDSGGEKGGRGPIDGRIAATRDLVQRAKPQPPTRKTAVDRFDPEGEYRAGARRHALKPLNLLAKAKDGRWLNRSTHALVKRFQSGIVLDLFQSEGKSQMAGHVPEDLAALQQCRSPCEHEGNRGV